MPNWCSTKIVFKGDIESIKALHDRISACIEKNDDIDPAWLETVADYFKLDQVSDCEQICRGWVSYVSDCANDDSFSITTQTAWKPMMQMWYDIVARDYKDRISIMWFATEPRNSIYASNNPEFFGRFGYVNYVSNTDENNSDCIVCGSMKQLIDTVNKFIIQYDLKADLITDKYIANLDSSEFIILDGDSSDNYISVNIVDRVADDM